MNSICVDESDMKKLKMYYEFVIDNNNIYYTDFVSEITRMYNLLIKEYNESTPKSLLGQTYKYISKNIYTEFVKLTSNPFLRYGMKN